MNVNRIEIDLRAFSAVLYKYFTYFLYIGRLSCLYIYQRFLSIFLSSALKSVLVMLYIEEFDSLILDLDYL